MRSMTGFGVGDVALGAGRISAEVRSVNQRFLDVRARLPREMADLSLFVEQLVRDRLRRGRVEIVVRAEGASAPPCVLDKHKARSAFAALAELRDELAPSADLPLGLLAAVPDLFAPPGGAALEDLRDAVRGAVAAALDAMERMCGREGARLADDLVARARAVRALHGRLAARADALRAAGRARLRDRLERLVADVDVRLDSGRLETEIAILADKSDVAEELTRLASHLDELDATLGAAAGEAVGRRLDFLLQEMAREANTLGAKAQDATVSQDVIAVKVEIERMREQVQNVE